ncbi:MAG TPA: ABC transporter ATP-binding protein [Kofleriaceae bacterium]
MTPFHGPAGPAPPRERRRLRDFISIFQYSGRAVALVWTTSRLLTLLLVLLSLVAGVLPALVAYVGKWLVDAVVAATASDGDGSRAMTFVLLEAGLIIAMAAVQRVISICQALLRAQLGHRVNVIILEKALTLELHHFEDSEFYDKLTRARREASSRPLSLVMRTFGLVQNIISLVTYGALLLGFSPLAVAVLAGASLPVFAAETRFSGEAFRLFRWRTPETRQQAYLETLIAREDSAKEVMLFGLGPTMLGRYDQIFRRLYVEDRNLTLRRGTWGFILGLLSSAAFYGVYAWIVLETAARHISLGDMTMYVLVFKQGQSALAAALAAIGGMYEDNLYLSNLYELLETEVAPARGSVTVGARPGDGIRFDDVSFTYPGGDRAALEGVSFHLPPGRKLALVGENGSGKTTLIKLLTRLYDPTGGRIVLDGTDLAEWDITTLRHRIGVIFQDFVRYQFLVGENIGVGDVDALEEEPRWIEAAEKGMAAPFIAELPLDYKTQLGRWFKGGRELSLGQWQKVALSRAFMRQGADILVLDEPTASMDAGAEALIFQRFREVTESQMAIVISHRFSTVRMADHIIVLAGGRILEEGSHEQLVALGGHYAHLFSLQAAGYR